MTYVDLISRDIADMAETLRLRQEPYAFATIVRTAGTTSAKPGAKAIIDAEGAIIRGFLGGGCARGAVRRAALKALETGATCLISVTPEESLSQRGLAAGSEVDGVTYARNGCPSRGTIDIFIEPILPMPELVVVGSSPVAMALADLAPRFHWSVETAIQPRPNASRMRAIIVATQGQGDLDAMQQALASDAGYIAFVGSNKKYAALAPKLVAAGADQARVDQVSAPAGLDIGAVTPEEIALSILAELIQTRRRFDGKNSHE